MKRTARIFFSFLASGLIAIGCSDSGGGECDPGIRENCACPQDSFGERICQDDGTFTACICPELGDGGVRSDGGVGSDGGGGGGPDAGRPDVGLEGECSPSIGRSDQDCMLSEAACGRAHTCVRRAWGEVNCFGDDTEGQLGRGAAAAPGPGEVWAHDDVLPVEGVATAVSIDSGGDHTCVVTLGGKAFCWGSHENGLLGDGEDPEMRPSSRAAVEVLELRRVESLSTGPRHTCVAQLDGAILCWGGNEFGVLGTGEDSERLPFSASPVAVRDLTDVRKVEAGGDFTCVLDKEGLVQCWGHADVGQLGDGRDDVDFSLEPVQVLIPGGLEAIDLSAGEHHACAVLADHSVWCWGSNERGEIGADELVLSSATPLQVVRADTGNPIDDMVSISAGAHHTCGLNSDRAVVCWGSWEPFCALEQKPVAAAPLHWYGFRARGVYAGAGHTCAIRNDGRLHCMGANEAAQSLPNDLTSLCEHDDPVSVVP